MRIDNLIFGTSPLIVHAPGLGIKKTHTHTALNQYWIPVLRNWESQKPALCREETKNNLTIITWNTTGAKGLCEISLDKLGLDYLVLGKNVSHWRNTDKITSALEIIDSVKTPYIMALDSFDLIVLRDPYEAVEKFKTMNCDMLFNGEKNYYPDYGLTATGNYAITDKWKKFEKSIAESEWKFLNSGASIAKTSFYKEVLLQGRRRYEIMENNRQSLPLPPDPVYQQCPDYKISDSDQLIFHWLHHDFYPRIKMDYRMEIFFNTVHTPVNNKTLTIAADAYPEYKTAGYRMKQEATRYLIKAYLAFKKKDVWFALAAGGLKKIFGECKRPLRAAIKYKIKITSSINKKKIRKRIDGFKETGVTQEKRNPRLIISVTSFPQRMYDIHFALYSLLNQTLKPDEIILWLGEKEFPNKEKNLSQSLLSLKNNGLKIKWCRDVGPHTKLIPALKEYPADIIVTADDDIYYPRNMLQILYDAYLKQPGLIHCHRAHGMTLDNKNNIRKYTQWTQTVSNVRPSFRNLQTGVGGVLYPPKALHEDVADENLFIKLSSTADDLWFWAMAVMNDTRINVVENNITKLKFTSFERESGISGEKTLAQKNIREGDNDKQLKNIIDHYPLIRKKIESCD